MKTRVYVDIFQAHGSSTWTLEIYDRQYRDHHRAIGLIDATEARWEARAWLEKNNAEMIGGFFYHRH